MSEDNVMDSFKAALSIVERTVEGLVPFRIIDIKVDKADNPYAKIDIDGKVFFMAPNTVGTKVWIADFPIKNTKEPVPPGYIGFPTEVAGVIRKYFDEKPKGAFQTIDGVGTISLNEVVQEEIRKVFEDYEYAAAEKGYHDKEEYEKYMEAEISTSLSFMQDLQGSLNKLETQKEMKTTTPEVDAHIEQAIIHTNEAIKSYLSNLDADVKSAVMGRLGEINIEKS